MEDSCMQQFWFALHVMPRHDKSVSITLRRSGYQELTPLYRAKRKWADRSKLLELPLFPGYVFCRFNPLFPVPILNIPGVVNIVRTGRTLAPVDDNEIASLQRLVESGLNSEPGSYHDFQVGQRVRIEGGPLLGLEGVVIELRKALRLVLSVSLLQRAILVEIDREWVTPIV